MPSIRIIPQTEEIYHIYNRGVDKRDIFINKADYIRFLHDLYEFNDTKHAPAFERRYRVQRFNVGGSTPYIKPHDRKRIVDVLAFCLMKNHYHLLLRQVVDNGITLFMQKLNTGYTCAVNVKYKRSGHLFQGRYKIKHVNKDKYLRHLICYIHLNPLKFLSNFDKNRKIDIEKTWIALNKYRWSSHLDYLDQDNFSAIIDKKFVSSVFDSTVEYEKFANDWIKYYDKKINVIDSVAVDFD